MELAKAAAEQAETAQARAEQLVRDGALAPVEVTRARAEMEARLADLALRALRAQSQARQEQYQQETRIVGHTIKNIQMIGFTEAVTKYLTSGFHLQVGDTLTRASMEAVRKTVHDYDENVTVEFVPTDDGQVEIRITEVASRR
jgi:outer membrane protein TolC